MRDQVLIPAIAILKKWQTEGKIEIFESDRGDPTQGKTSGWPGLRKDIPESSGKRRVAPKKDPKVVANFGRISAILFPMREAHRLNMAELNDVNCLLRHLTLGRSIFVTRNTASFIDEGRQQKLQTQLQISVMTPDETVKHLSKVEGWPIEKQR